MYRPLLLNNPSHSKCVVCRTLHHRTALGSRRPRSSETRSTPSHYFQALCCLFAAPDNPPSCSRGLRSIASWHPHQQHQSCPFAVSSIVRKCIYATCNKLMLRHPHPSRSRSLRHRIRVSSTARGPLRFHNLGRRSIAPCSKCGIGLHPTLSIRRRNTHDGRKWSSH